MTESLNKGRAFVDEEEEEIDVRGNLLTQTELFRNYAE
jgi:hypothetical protein